jgi:hypothetical protein
LKLINESEVFQQTKIMKKRQKWPSQIECPYVQSPIPNPVSGPDFSVFVTNNIYIYIYIYIYIHFTYPVRCFHVPPGLSVPHVEDH